MLIKNMFISEEIIEEIGLVALEGDEVDIAHNLGLDCF